MPRDILTYYFEEGRRLTDKKGGLDLKTVMEARYLQLVEAKEAGKASPSVPTAKASLTAQEDAAVGAFNALDPEEQAEHLSFWQSPGGQEILAGWERTGGVMKNAQAADALVADLKSGLPAESVDGFEWEVSELPMAVQIGMSAELAHPYLPPSVSASREEVDLFGTTEEGADLIREWGTSAARNVGVIRERLRRISDRLSAPNQESFKTFIANITPDEFKSIGRFLVR